MKQEMSTMSQQQENNAALPTETSTNRKELLVHEGKLAKDGDKVIDIKSKIEGELKFSVWAWIVKWSDGITTIVQDQYQLILKD